MAQTNGNASNKLKVAICGGGMGGLCLAYGLLKHPHLDVHIFEAAPAFTEIGAGVSLSINGQKAMEMISPELLAALTRAGAKSYGIDVRALMGHGPRRDEVIFDDRFDGASYMVHRGHFLEHLVEIVPDNVKHTNKRLVAITEDGNTPSSPTIHFEDGTTFSCDVLIGADGIRSSVRSYVLGAEHPATDPKFTGVITYRRVVSSEEAAKELDVTLLDGVSKLAWMGDKGMLLCYYVDNGANLNLAATLGVETWDHDRWTTEADTAALIDNFKTYSDKAQGFIRLLDRPEVMAWALWDHEPAPTYTKNNICIAGDAAHSAIPYLASGFGQAVEDAMILETLLGSVHTKGQINPALRAYDNVRRQRTQDIVVAARKAGRLWMGRLEGVGVDMEKMKQAGVGISKFIDDIDLEKHRADALAMMRAMMDTK